MGRRGGGGMRGGGGGRGFGGSGGGRSLGGSGRGGARPGGGLGGLGGLGGSRSGSGLSGGNRPRSNSSMSPLAAGGLGYMMGRGSRPRRGRYYGGGGGGGCAGLSSLVTILLVLFMVMVLISFFQSFISSSAGINIGGTSVTRSTIQREPLPKGSVNETGYYTDELRWVQNQTQLTAGMRNFYQATGVQPYLYITGDINGNIRPSLEEGVAFAEAKYNELFTDQAHLLFVFFENEHEEADMFYWRGSLAQTVLDDEAMDILMDRVTRHYYNDRLSEDEFFSKAFDDAGKRIMKVYRSPWIPVMAVGIIAFIIVLAYGWWKKSITQKNLEAEQTERILNSNLDTFGSGGAAEDLAKKYDNNKN